MTVKMNPQIVRRKLVEVENTKARYDARAGER